MVNLSAIRFPPPSTLDIYFLNATAAINISTLSLHDALPIFIPRPSSAISRRYTPSFSTLCHSTPNSTCFAPASSARSEEHTSELQSQFHLVCRLLPEKK